MEKQIENKDFKTAYPYDETKIAKFKYFIKGRVLSDGRIIS